MFTYIVKAGCNSVENGTNSATIISKTRWGRKSELLRVKKDKSLLQIKRSIILDKEGNRLNDNLSENQ